MSQLIADVCVIDEIQPHPNADRLEIAKVKGWFSVVKKGEWKCGDKCIYLPPDTAMPLGVSDKFGITNYCSPTPDGMRRVRAARLRGEASYGVVLPLDSPDWPVGYSVVGEYGLVKYEPPQPLREGQFLPEPASFFRYTDIDRFGDCAGMFAPGEHVVVEEKIHGRNCRVGLIYDGEARDFTLVAGSHRCNVAEHDEIGIRSVYWTPVDERMEKLVNHIRYEMGGKDVLVFGELFGRKMQDMHYGRQGVDFAGFDICVGGRYLNYDDRTRLFTTHGIAVPPLLYRGPFDEAKLKGLVDGPTLLCWPDEAGPFAGREGIVIRPREERQYRNGRAIAKWVSVDYLARKGEATEYH